MENKLNDLAFWEHVLKTYTSFNHVLICRVCLEFEWQWFYFEKEIRQIAQVFIDKNLGTVKMGDGLILFSREKKSSEEAIAERVAFLEWNIKRCLKNESHK